MRNSSAHLSGFSQNQMPRGILQIFYKSSYRLENCHASVSVTLCCLH